MDGGECSSCTEATVLDPDTDDNNRTERSTEFDDNSKVLETRRPRCSESLQRRNSFRSFDNTAMGRDDQQRYRRRYWRLQILVQIENGHATDETADDPMLSEFQVPVGRYDRAGERQQVRPAESSIARESRSSRVRHSWKKKILLNKKSISSFIFPRWRN